MRHVFHTTRLVTRLHTVQSMRTLKEWQRLVDHQFNGGPTATWLRLAVIDVFPVVYEHSARVLVYDPIASMRRTVTVHF